MGSCSGYPVSLGTLFSMSLFAWGGTKGTLGWELGDMDCAPTFAQTAHVMLGKSYLPLGLNLRTEDFGRPLLW